MLLRLWLAGATAAWSAGSVYHEPAARLEYRLQAEPAMPGEDSTWPDGKPGPALEREPFLVLSALSGVRVGHSYNEQFYEVRWTHRAADAKALAALALKHPGRPYCILLDRKLQECRAFPPAKGKMDAKRESLSIFYTLRSKGRVEKDAQALARRLRATFVR